MLRDSIASIIGLSYLIDPALLGNGISVKNRRSLEDTMISMPVDNAQTINKVCMELLYLQYNQSVIITNHKNQENSFRFQLLVKQKKSPLERWLTNEADFPNLQKITTKLFSVATSSAASEHNFSVMGFIHSKLSNSLSPNTAKKLVFIKSNLATFYDFSVPTCDDVKCSSSDDDS